MCPFPPQQGLTDIWGIWGEEANIIIVFSSCAGLFIHAHLGFDWTGVWMHIDMAAPSAVSIAVFLHLFTIMISKVGERATGYGVSLLNSLFGTASKAALLQVSFRPKSCLSRNNPLQQAASPGRDNGALGGEDRGPSQGQTKKPRIEWNLLDSGLLLWTKHLQENLAEKKEMS